MPIQGKGWAGASPEIVATMSHQKVVLLDFFTESSISTTADLNSQTATEFLAWRSGMVYREHKKTKTVSVSSQHYELQVLKQLAEVAHSNVLDVS